MTYYFNKGFPVPFDDALRRVTGGRRQKGFGLIGEIALKARLGVDFRHDRILGACNPKLAYEALQLEDKVGTMVPCNVVVQDAGEGKTQVAAIDPVASMLAIDNPRRREAAAKLQALLKKVIAAL
jgi:uncharacterized protein (DUF302 family)